MKKVCEREGHKRLGWAFTGLLFLGCTLTFAYMRVIDAGAMSGMIAGFCAGVYLGVIKLGRPTPNVRQVNKEPEEAPNVTKPAN